MKGSTTYKLVSSSKTFGVSDILALVKIRLTSLVVLTAVGAFYIASGCNASLIQLLVLAIGGLGVTGASNAINQVLEQEYDAQMKRTQDRPLPTGRITMSMAVLLAGFLCVIGVTALSFFNSYAAFFGMLAFVLYAFVYTPLKRYSRAAVFIGAIAGAMPMLIGVIAFSSELTTLAIVLFLVQFAWQFPHFWSIAYLGFEDYSNAEFNFIPVDQNGEIDKSVAVSSIAYSIVLLVIVAFMYSYAIVGIVATFVLATLSVVYMVKSVSFWKSFDMTTAKSLMFTSLLYIPLFLVVMIVDGLI